MYHSINFGDKNTWDEWRLVPTSRPVFNPPVQKVKTLDIPGSDGVIDLSTSLTGYPVFQNRTGSFEFIVVDYKYWTPMRDNVNDTVRDYVNDDIKGAGFRQWYETYSDIMNYLHGRTMRAVLEDDPDYYYEGRFTVNSWKSEKNWSKITIDYDVGPYKWSVKTSSELFPDIFADITVPTAREPTDGLVIEVGPELFGTSPTFPTFTVSSTAHNGIRVVFYNRLLGYITKTIEEDGVFEIPEFILSGQHDARIYMSCDSGTATVTIDFRRGVL